MTSDPSCECLNDNKSSFYQEKRFDEECVSTPIVNDFSNNLIFEELFIEILSFVSFKDLICNCRLVCKQWKWLIDSQSIWRLKCERENVKIPSCKLLQLPEYYYRNIYIHSTSKMKNLIKNPCGENKLEGWETSDGKEFTIENPPVSCDLVPAEVGSQSCFTTVYFPCQKYQYIELTKHPIDEYLLRHDLVNIIIGEWYAARFDSAAVYDLQVILYNKNHEKVDSFEFWFVEKLWAGGQWHLVTHKFDKVSEVCFIRFCHKSERVFGCGHHGSKTTGAFVELCIKYS